MGVKAVVFDVEGTICPISFVKDVLYPYSTSKVRELAKKVRFPVEQGEEQGDEFKRHLSQFPGDVLGDEDALLDHIDGLVKNDVKASYWKGLQGYLWRFGYECGEIKAPLFRDVYKWLPVLKERYDLYIYSSGSVAAQKLLLSHCDHDVDRDLTALITGHFDTTNAGPKTHVDSYRAIQSKLGLQPSEILFLSDNHLEIQAARDAGWKTALTVRPDNPPLPPQWNDDPSIISSLDDLHVD